MLRRISIRSPLHEAVLQSNGGGVRGIVGAGLGERFLQEKRVLEKLD